MEREAACMAGLRKTGTKKDRPGWGSRERPLVNIVDWCLRSVYDIYIGILSFELGHGIADRF